MLRALWFFFQLAIVVSAAVWIISQQGAVDIAWNGYDVSLNLGVFLLAIVLFTLAVLSVFRLIGAIVDFPNVFSRHRRDKARAKGFVSLTRGFVAIAAGDAKKASQYARDVRGLLPEERGLPLLLEAQAARLRGEEQVARVAFEELLTGKDAAFFGIRGLLKSSLDEGDTLKALGYARAALEKSPKQPWILKSVYDLELRNRQWEQAAKTLERARKAKGVDEAQAIKDEVALLMLLAERDRADGREDEWLRKTERAVKLDPSFVPAAVALAEYHIVKNKTGKVAGIIERAWKLNPHPELAGLWGRIAPEIKVNDTTKRLRWFEKLADMRPDSADGQIAAAKAAMEAGLWGEARTHLVHAETLRPMAAVYRVRADLEEQSSHDAVLVRGWLEKAADAPAESVWYCRQTGHIYDRWSPVAEPHGAFNTIEWGQPFLPASGTNHPALSAWKDPLMVENV